MSFFFGLKYRIKMKEVCIYSNNKRVENNTITKQSKSLKIYSLPINVSWTLVDFGG